MVLYCFFHLSTPHFSHEPLTIESAIEALAEPDVSITTNGGSSSHSQDEASDNDVALCHDDSSILMPNVEDSGFSLEPPGTRHINER